MIFIVIIYLRPKASATVRTYTANEVRCWRVSIEHFAVSAGRQYYAACLCACVCVYGVWVCVREPKNLPRSRNLQLENSNYAISSTMIGFVYANTIASNSRAHARATEESIVACGIREEKFNRFYFACVSFGLGKSSAWPRHSGEAGTFHWTNYTYKTTFVAHTRVRFLSVIVMNYPLNRHLPLKVRNYYYYYLLFWIVLSFSNF